MLEVAAKDTNKLLATHDQQLVQALPADRADPALGDRVGVRRLHGCADDLDTGRAPHVIERPGELGVPVVDQEPERSGLIAKDGDEVVGLLGNPEAGGMVSDAAKMDPPAAKLDEEQHIHSPQEDRVDGEESGRGESHPPALAEPCVNLSAHTAPITQPYGHAPSRQCANRVGSRLAMSARNRLARLR
jgi:hypothetical protein